jgi:mono/diheme cytochrome c family protein
MRLMTPAALAALVALAGCAADGPQGGAAAAPPPSGLTGSADRGAVLVRLKCAGCHAVERSGDSPMAAAPPFRNMGVLYPVADLQEAFAEGLVTAHPAMPAFEFEPQEIADVIAYLEHVSGTGTGR